MPIQGSLSDIIKGCIHNNRFSQKEFYIRYFGYAVAICVRYCNNDDDVNLVVNDGFLKIYRSLERFNPKHSNYEADLKAWIKRIMINTAIDFLRSRHKNFVLSEVTPQHFDMAHETANSIDHLQYKEILSIIQKLSPVYRTVFNLYVLDGYKHEEIAEKLKISVGTSKSNLAKARVNIQKMLKESDFNYYEQKAI